MAEVIFSFLRKGGDMVKVKQYAEILIWTAILTVFLGILPST